MQNSKITQKILDTYRKNPIYDLAHELYYTDKITELKLKQMLTENPLYGMSDPFKTELLNCMRDVERLHRLQSQ